MIFPSNDIKYDTNKTRATRFAESQGEGILWSPAKDVATTEVLKECPSVLARKVEWLSKHDRDTGDLYGMLPLVHACQ